MTKKIKAIRFGIHTLSAEAIRWYGITQEEAEQISPYDFYKLEYPYQNFKQATHLLEQKRTDLDGKDFFTVHYELFEVKRPQTLTYLTKLLDKDPETLFYFLSETDSYLLYLNDYELPYSQFEIKEKPIMSLCYSSYSPDERSALLSFLRHLNEKEPARFKHMMDSASWDNFLGETIYEHLTIGDDSVARFIRDLYAGQKYLPLKIGKHPIDFAQISENNRERED